MLSVGSFYAVYGQCTPTDCNSDLIAQGITYGGTCDSTLMDGVVGQPYNDFESFVITDECFNAQLIDPGQPNLDIAITNVDNLSFEDMPAGISAASNAASYSPPSNGYITGCVSYTGTPTEVGIFGDTIRFLADIELCGFFPVPQNDNNATYRLWMKIKPDPSFTIASSYCTTDAAVTLTPNVTTGGVFTINGAPATSFDPAALGAGTYEVKYVVSKMEGAALFPASDSLSVTVSVVTNGGTVYFDGDNDGFGDPNNTTTVTGCTIPANYVANADDCDDSNNAINPNATDIPDNGIDEDCDGSDATLGLAINKFEVFTLYPNPATETIRILGYNLQNKVTEVFIYDLNGNIVKTIDPSEINNEISISGLNPGIYVVRIVHTAGTATARFAKQ